MNKKRLGVLFLGLLLVLSFILSVNVVSAQEEQMFDEYTFTACLGLKNCEVYETQLGQATCDIASAGACAFNQVGFTSDILTPLLLGVLLWIIIYSISKGLFGGDDTSTFKGKLFPATIALIITLLAFLYIPTNFIDAIGTQFGAMGTAILAGIPLIIMLYFTVNVSSSLLLSKAIWLFYVVYYFVLFVYQLATTPGDGSASGWFLVNLPYLGAILIGLILFFGIGYFRSLLFEGKLEGEEEEAIKDIKFRKLGRKLEREETKSRI